MEEGLLSSVVVVEVWRATLEYTFVEELLEPEVLCNSELPRAHPHCQLLNLELVVEGVMQLVPAPL